MNHGQAPPRRPPGPQSPHPQDDVAAIKGILSAFAIYAIAGGLGLLVTWLLMHWGPPSG